MEKAQELHEDASFEIISSCDITDMTSFELHPSILCDDVEESSSLVFDFDELFTDSMQFPDVVPLSDNRHCSSPDSLEKDFFNNTEFLSQEHYLSDSSMISVHPDVVPISALDEDQNSSSSPESSTTFYCAQFGDLRTSQLESKSLSCPASQVICEEPISTTGCFRYLVTEDTVKKSSMINKAVIGDPSIAEHCCRQGENLPTERKVSKRSIHQLMKQFSEEEITAKCPKSASISTQDTESFYHEIYSFENSGSSSVLNAPNSFIRSGITKDIWNWVCQNEFLQKVTEKAKSSVHTVITTLDPGMKNVLKPQVPITALTMVQDEAFAISRAFKKKFSTKVSLRALHVNLGNIPPQPVGFKSGLYCAEAKIRFIRLQKLVSWDDIVVSISPLIVETTPNRWHYCTCIMLNDPLISLSLHNFTQLIPVPNEYVKLAQARTPDNYHLKDLGLRVTIGQVLHELTDVNDEYDWQYAASGTSYYEVLELAATLLAGMYRGYETGIY